MVVLPALAIAALVWVLTYPWPEAMDFARAEHLLTGPAQTEAERIRWTDRVLALVHFVPDPESRLGQDQLLAGNSLTLADLYVYKALGVVAGLLLAGLIFAAGDSTMAILVLVIALAAWSLPDSRIRGQAKRTRLEIARRLPAFLQALTMMTEAGMNLPPAIAAFAENEESALGRELRLALDQTAMGVPLSTALMQTAQRCGVDDLYRVVAALAQATERGAAGLAETCRSQASEAWVKRKDMARELAQQASSKMFLPLFLLVLPTLFLFMMGPAIFQMIQNF